MRFGQPLSFGEVPHTNPTVVPTQTGKQRSSCHLQTLQLFPRSCGLPEGAWNAEYSIKHGHSAECSLQYLQTLQSFPTAYKPYNCSHANRITMIFLLFTNPTDACMQQNNPEVPTTYNTYKPYSCSLPHTTPTTVPAQLRPP